MGLRGNEVFKDDRCLGCQGGESNQPRQSHLGVPGQSHLGNKTFILTRIQHAEKKGTL